MNTHIQSAHLPPGANTRSGPSPAYFRLSHLRKMKGRQQVAAVCYRLSDDGVEFLLVETRRRRWTFPKGSAEPGLTHAQAAALEAYEEAGVHGRIEEDPFTRYIRSKRGGKQKKPNPSEQSPSQQGAKDIFIDAHLCEVLRLSAPEEARRNPTWFPAAKAKRRLREDRSPANGDELARVVDLAVIRIRELHSAPAPKRNARVIDAPQLANRRINSDAKGSGAKDPQAVARGTSQGRIPEARLLEARVSPDKDPLQRVQFEAAAIAPARMQAAFLSYLRQEVAENLRHQQSKTPVRQALAIKAQVPDVTRLTSVPTQQAPVTTIGQGRKPNHKASVRKNF
jgi:8-oxo-dGTP pyrophosphatase MutT (NUDIX family)